MREFNNSSSSVTVKVTFLTDILGYLMQLTSCNSRAPSAPMRPTDNPPPYDSIDVSRPLLKGTVTYIRNGQWRLSPVDASPDQYGITTESCKNLIEDMTTLTTYVKFSDSLSNMSGNHFYIDCNNELVKRPNYLKHRLKMRSSEVYKTQIDFTRKILSSTDRRKIKSAISKYTLEFVKNIKKTITTGDIEIL